ncbi:Putative C2 domain, phosphatidylinositol-specific phospholipase C, X domain, EF-hand domain pair [Septoria linicola]|uniref:Phosphoinositide phospholipase C n=1 Tax=Septoria linicola TaxID=215465 RepID=A0A9Q9ECK8_9PEZI|nr:Putative C2 domain, phosphatidylinositol-specific phospholipase C, X domain, EF-hand domain pair [Septoria linicola]
MNLSSDTHGQDAFPAGSESAAGSTPKAQVASAHPSPARINTAIATTVTPASTGMSATSIPSRSSSLHHIYSIKSYPTVSQDSLAEARMSPQMYPSPSPVPRRAMSDRTFSERSPSPHTRVGHPGAMAEAMSTAGRGTGLLRRLSRGAHNKLRRRASTTHSLRMRDQSAGPLLVRRRSDSNGASDFQDVSDLELDSNTEDMDDYPPYVKDRNNALGINVARPNLPSNGSSSTFQGGIAPASSAILEKGTWIWKLTRRNRKRLLLRLDSSSARVCWHPNKIEKSFFIDDVREVRIGEESRNARDDIQVPAKDEELFITIVYDVPERSKGRIIKTMNVIMPDKFILNLWTSALNVVTRQRIEIMNALSSNPEKAEKGMAQAWKLLMKQKDISEEEHMTLSDAMAMCRQLEINCSESAVKTHFKAIARDEHAHLTYDQYKNFIQSFRERKDITHIFKNWQLGTDHDMDLKTFLEFMRNDQKVDIEKDRAHWEGVFEKFARPVQNRPILPDAVPTIGQKVWTTQSFQSFLTSSYTSPLAPLVGETVLDRPFNEYFISSSHNTYLLGRQVAGTSSVEGYIAALVKGCRCVEIDCWDGDDGRPIVTHGRTMTSKIPFEDCVSVVARYAFHSSPYPLIVSLEVHCNPEQQLVMVELMRKYFGSMMVMEPISNNTVSLPSPEELRNRILIKVKASAEIEQAQWIAESTTGRSRARSLTSTFGRTPSAENSSAMSSPLVSSSTATSPSEVNGVFTPRGSTTSGAMTPSSSADDSDEIRQSADKQKRRGNKTRIIHELGKLGVYAQGIKFGAGFQTPAGKTYNHIYSFNEHMFDDLCTKKTDNKALLEKHNVRHLLRVYPAAKRVDSSNFNPLSVWRRGGQMAALNWQTYDVPQQINEAMFAAGSDRLGYVLKPEELRHAKHQPIFDAIDQGPRNEEKRGKKSVRFSVDIISAQRLPRPRNQSTGSGMNPYIEFEMFYAEDKERTIAKASANTDASSQDAPYERALPSRSRTRIVEGNGFDPQYHQNITTSVETKFPGLVFVRWTVWHAPQGKKSGSNGVLLATHTAKLSSLQQGYRHLPLFNPQGEQYRDAKLFVKIKTEAPVFMQLPNDNAYYAYMDANSSPRFDSSRPERGWPRRIFSRASSQRRRDLQNEVPGPLSRTSSMDRESLRSH